MQLNQLSIEQLRNLTALDLSFGDSLNFIVGANGSGKTTVLEAIYLAVLGRSFRASYSPNLIQHHQNWLRIILKGHDTQQNYHIGFEKQANQSLLRINGETYIKHDLISSCLPLRLIHPGLAELVFQPPSKRRDFLDWGIYQHHRTYLSIWRRYRKTLKQRNNLLRQGQTSSKLLAGWDDALQHYGMMIDRFRKSYVDQLNTYIAQNQSLNLLNETMQINYYQGWSDQVDFGTSLKSNLAADQRLGYTRHGPHEADLKLLSNQRPAKTILSRGQAKLYSIFLWLLQSQQINAIGLKGTLLLLDDIAAELDERNLERVLALTQTLKLQSICTLTSVPKYLPSTATLFNLDTR